MDLQRRTIACSTNLRADVGYFPLHGPGLCRAKLMMPGMQFDRSILVAIDLEENIFDVKTSTETPPDLPLLLANSETCCPLTCVADDGTWNEMRVIDVATTYFADICMRAHQVLPLSSVGPAFEFDITLQDNLHVMPLRVPAQSWLAAKIKFRFQHSDSVWQTESRFGRVRVCHNAQSVTQQPMPSRSILNVYRS